MLGPEDHDFCHRSMVKCDRGGKSLSHFLMTLSIFRFKRDPCEKMIDVS